MRSLRILLLCALCLLGVPLDLSPSSSSRRSSSVLFAAAASWASPTGTFVDGPLLSVAALNVTGALHVGSTNVATVIAELQAQISTLLTLVTELSGRVTAAEQMSGTDTPLTTTVKALRDLTPGAALTNAVITQGERITAAENLNGDPTPLTTTLKQVRDLTSGTLLYTAVNNMRTLVAGTTLTNTVLGLRDMTAAGGSLVTTVKQSQTDVTTLYGQVSDAYANDTALATRLSAAENLNGIASTLTSTVKQVRDLTSGTPLYTAVDGLRTLAAGTSLTNTVNALAAPPLLRFMTDPWMAANDGGWLGTWSQYSDGNSYPVHMTLKNGLVKLQGIASGGSAGSLVLRLPLGYRPANNRVFLIDVVMQPGEVMIDHLTGDIFYRNGPATPAWISFDHIIFLAAPSIP
jgi:hypothetical protein